MTTALQLIGEIHDRLAALEGLMKAETEVGDFDGVVIYDRENNSWHGISRAARQLKVTPQHLARVLRGERQSKRILEKVQVKEVK
jgi:non-canonical (house-cleaning) NTP pyrophosphatase